MDDLESRATGGQGPGIETRQGMDTPLLIGIVFVLIGYTPIAWYEAALGYGYFGPIAWPAILCMVGVLFGAIALLRALDLKDARLRTWAIIVLAAGVVRLFVLPWF